MNRKNLIIFLLLLLLAYSLGSSRSKILSSLPLPVPTLIPTLSPSPLPSPLPTPTGVVDSNQALEVIFKSSFMSECVDVKGTNFSTCLCSYNYLNNKYGIGELIRIYSDPSSSEAKKVTVDAVVACYSL